MTHKNCSQVELMRLNEMKFSFQMISQKFCLYIKPIQKAPQTLPGSFIYHWRPVRGLHTQICEKNTFHPLPLDPIGRFPKNRDTGHSGKFGKIWQSTRGPVPSTRKL